MSRSPKSGPNDSARSGPGAAGLSTSSTAGGERHAQPCRPQDRSAPGQAARWLGIDRNPLRRGTDRVEAALRLVLIILVVVAVPAAAAAAGRWADHYALHRAQAERTVNHQVTAVLLADAPESGIPDPYTSVQTAWVLARSAARDSRPGPARSSPGRSAQGQHGADLDRPVGRSHHSAAGPPCPRRRRLARRHRDLPGVVVLLLAAGVLVRRGLDRLRLRAWEAEWRASGPLGSGRRS